MRRWSFSILLPSNTHGSFFDFFLQRDRSDRAGSTWCGLMFFNKLQNIAKGWQCREAFPCSVIVVCLQMIWADAIECFESCDALLHTDRSTRAAQTRGSPFCIIISKILQGEARNWGDPEPTNKPKKNDNNNEGRHYQVPVSFLCTRTQQFLRYSP